MEFMQFHPTVLYIAGSSRSLITEAMRGEGATLVDRHGNRFMSEFDVHGELAPRDVVSRAIVTQMDAPAIRTCTWTSRTWNPLRFAHDFPALHPRARIWPGHYDRLDSGPARGTLHDRRRNRRHRRPHDAAGIVGRRRVHVERPARCESAGLEQLTGRARLRSACRAQAAREAAAMADDFRALPLENPPSQEALEPLDLADIRNSLKSLVWRRRWRAARPRTPGRGG